MKIKTIISRYLRNVSTDCIKYLENRSAEIMIDGIKIYISKHINKNECLISDKGETLQNIKLSFKEFYKIYPHIYRTCSKDGVISVTSSDRHESLLQSTVYQVESCLKLIKQIKKIREENNDD